MIIIIMIIITDTIIQDLVQENTNILMRMKVMEYARMKEIKRKSTIEKKKKKTTGVFN